MADKGARFGSIAFIIGVIIAIIASLIPSVLQSLVVSLLVLLGLIVGFLNITEKETSAFLVASVAIMIALFTAGSIIQSNLITLGLIGTYLWALMSNINVFVFPATIVVALKAIYGLSRSK